MPVTSFKTPLLSPDILAEEAMLVRYRIAVLESAFSKEQNPFVKLDIRIEIVTQKRILERVTGWWIAKHRE